MGWCSEGCEADDGLICIIGRGWCCGVAELWLLLVCESSVDPISERTHLDHGSRGGGGSSEA